MMPEDIKLSAWVRFGSWWDALCKRKYICRKFCLELGIDYPPKSVKKYKLPRKYLINTQRIQSLGEKRDRILQHYYSNYLENEKKITEDLAHDATELTNFEQRLVDERASLSRLKQKIKRIKDNTAYVTTEHHIHTTQTRIKQFEDDCKNLATQILDNQVNLDKNATNFLAQKKIVEDVFAKHIDGYILSITKKIQERINFTNFEYLSPEYSDTVNEAVNHVKNILRKEKKRGKKAQK